MSGNKKIILPSGKELEIGIVSFSVGMKLFKTIAKELKNVKIDAKNVDFEKMFDKDLSGEQINFFKDIFATLVASEELENILFECFKKCVYDKTKRVDRDLFDNDLEARADFLSICWEVAKYNLSFFLKNHFTL